MVVGSELCRFGSGSMENIMDPDPAKWCGSFGSGSPTLLKEHLGPWQFCKPQIWHPGTLFSAQFLFNLGMRENILKHSLEMEKKNTSFRDPKRTLRAMIILLTQFILHTAQWPYWILMRKMFHFWRRIKYTKNVPPASFVNYLCCCWFFYSQNLLRPCASGKSSFKK